MLIQAKKKKKKIWRTSIQASLSEISTRGFVAPVVALLTGGAEGAEVLRIGDARKDKFRCMGAICLERRGAATIGRLHAIACLILGVALQRAAKQVFFCRSKRFRKVFVCFWAACCGCWGLIRLFLQLTYGGTKSNRSSVNVIMWLFILGQWSKSHV